MAMHRKTHPHRRSSIVSWISNTRKVASPVSKRIWILKDENVWRLLNLCNSCGVLTGHRQCPTSWSAGIRSCGFCCVPQGGVEDRSSQQHLPWNTTWEQWQVCAFLLRALHPLRVNCRPVDRRKELKVTYVSRSKSVCRIYLTERVGSIFGCITSREVAWPATSSITFCKARTSTRRGRHGVG